MISAVERQISATTIVPIRTAWFEGSSQMCGMSGLPIPRCWRIVFR